MYQQYVFALFKLFASKHKFISTFFVLSTIIGIHTRSELSMHSSYRDEHQNVNVSDSDMNQKNNFEKIFHDFNDIAKENLIRRCDSTLPSTEVEYGDTITTNDLVTKQYESLPYPEVKEDALLWEKNHYSVEGKKPLLVFSSIMLEQMNHYLFEGNEDFRNTFRHLEAGGGTAAGASFQGEQLNHTNGEVVYIDFSSASAKIAQRRARYRRLQNIVWVRSWIEEVRYLGLGSFDVSQCTGVLHHLKDPLFGLNVLKDVLVEKGKLILMVYAKYGRTAVYLTQHLMKMINNYAENDIKAELQNTKQIIADLPFSNWLTSTNFVHGHKKGNSGIYDLLLHKRDISYSLETLFNWIKNAGLHFVELEDYYHRYLLKPQHVFQDNNIKRIVSKLNLSKAFHVTEILQGKVIKHQFYSSKCKENIADIKDPSNLIYINGNALGWRDAMDKKNNNRKIGNQTFFRATLSPRALVQYQTDYCNVPPMTKNSKHVTIGYRSTNFIQFLISRLLRFKDGVRLKDLFFDYKMAFNSTVKENELQFLLEDFYDSMKDSDVFLLKKFHIEPFPKTNSYYCFKFT